MDLSSNPPQPVNKPCLHICVSQRFAGINMQRALDSLLICFTSGIELLLHIFG